MLEKFCYLVFIFLSLGSRKHKVSKGFVVRIDMDIVKFKESYVHLLLGKLLKNRCELLIDVAENLVKLCLLDLGTYRGYYQFITVGAQLECRIRADLKQFHNRFVDNQCVAVSVFNKMFDHISVSNNRYIHSIYEYVVNVKRIVNEKTPAKSTGV